MCSNWFKTCSNVSNVVQPVQNLFKCVQNCSKIISLSSARGPTWQAELDLVYQKTAVLGGDGVRCLMVNVLNVFHFLGTFPLVGALLRIWSSCIFCINNRYCTLDCLLRCIPLLYFTLMPLTPYVAMAAEDWEWRRVDLGGLVTEKML